MRKKLILSATFIAMFFLILCGVSLIIANTNTCPSKNISNRLKYANLDLGIDDTPDSLHILAYNIQMRPTTTFADGQYKRANFIPKQLKGYDVIIFSEAFDDDVMIIFFKNLFKEYGLDYNQKYEYRTESLGKDQYLNQDGGVVIFSRWKIQKEKQETFGDKCDGFDCFADKGVIYVAVNKKGRIYHIFGTHTQAENNKKAQEVRQAQFKIIRDFIDHQEIPSDEPVIIGGDLNVDLINFKNEYQTILNILKSDQPTLKGQVKFTIDPKNSLTDSKYPEYLDYILYAKTHLKPVKSFNQVIPLYSDKGWKLFDWFYWECQRWDLSDHYPVYGYFDFSR